ncbi:MAG: hypothetical protein K2L70_05520 [Clostridia bacterium]|nr:hypothetical protein [Clostridia bacterium]
MKKRHFWAAITIMVLAIVMAVSFVACNGDKNPANMKGEEVTAEQWVKAFDYSDVKNATINQVTTGTEDGIEFTITEVTEYDGDKIHTKKTTEYIDEEDGLQKEVDESYVAKEGDKVYRYSYDEEEKTWSREELSYNVDLSIGNFDQLSDNFSKFTYDKDKNGYVGNLEGYNVLIKIIGGKFVYAEQTITNSDDGMTTKFTLTISGVGSTSISLPPVAEDNNN